MEKETIERILNNPDYRELVRRRSAFAWKLSLAMLALYYAFIVLIAFWPQVLGVRTGEGVMTVGIPVGIFIILFAFLLTGIYTYRANTRFDELERRVRAELQEEGGI